MLAVRQVSQLNSGKKTAGVDKVKSINFKTRFEYAKHLRGWRKHKHAKLREIPISKPNGKKRILKVPTIKDRAWQCLMKYALEPIAEVGFAATSYGFRPGRSAYDAQRMIFNKASQKQRWIVDLDIEACFDRISHSTILKRIPGWMRRQINQMLQTIGTPEFPDQGVAQGGIISPLLSNIALNDVEDTVTFRNGSSRIIRYADDMVVICDSEEQAQQALETIKANLAAKGLNVSQAKTRIVPMTEGFDFLGWYFYHYRGHKPKIVSIPSKKSVKNYKLKVKEILAHSQFSVKVKTQKLQQLTAGWKRYHQYCDLGRIYTTLWAMENRAWQRDQRLFKGFIPTKYKVFGHNNVRGTKSPYDGDLLYWSKRNCDQYDGIFHRTLRKQEWKCAECKLLFTNEERINLHHRDGKHNNWKANNLAAIHESCHDYIHMK
jgi:group II intron reverse transcriptase/maturase